MIFLCFSACHWIPVCSGTDCTSLDVDVKWALLKSGWIWPVALVVRGVSTENHHLGRVNSFTPWHHVPHVHCINTFAFEGQEMFFNRPITRGHRTNSLVNSFCTKGILITVYPTERNSFIFMKNSHLQLSFRNLKCRLLSFLTQKMYVYTHKKDI